ncbi:hypothetical protein [Aureivirga marina]|uniref:hypothetical protein n=1 Tax=Aureivirga marina TaxID=1182451 RepID=UPI0018CA3915|nr:hypothetical protein [Aureivirga marina]
MKAIITSLVLIFFISCNKDEIHETKTTDDFNTRKSRNTWENWSRSLNQRTGFSIITEDEHLLTSGEAYNLVPNEIGHPVADYVLKLDKNANVVWYKSFVNSSELGYVGKGITESQGHYYEIIDSHHFSPALLIKIAPNGNEVWQREFNGMYRFEKIVPDNDDGVFILGSNAGKKGLFIHVDGKGNVLKELEYEKEGKSISFLNILQKNPNQFILVGSENLEEGIVTSLNIAQEPMFTEIYEGNSIFVDILPDSNLENFYLISKFPQVLKMNSSGEVLMEKTYQGNTFQSGKLVGNGEIGIVGQKNEAAWFLKIDKNGTQKEEKLYPLDPIYPTEFSTISEKPSNQGFIFTGKFKDVWLLSTDKNGGILDDYPFPIEE